MKTMWFGGRGVKKFTNTWSSVLVKMLIIEEFFPTSEKRWRKKISDWFERNCLSLWNWQLIGLLRFVKLVIESVCHSYHWHYYVFWEIPSSCYYPYLVSQITWNIILPILLLLLSCMCVRSKRFLQLDRRFLCTFWTNYRDRKPKEIYVICRLYLQTDLLT